MNTTAQITQDKRKSSTRLLDRMKRGEERAQTCACNHSGKEGSEYDGPEHKCWLDPAPGEQLVSRGVCVRVCVCGLKLHF